MSLRQRMREALAGLMRPRESETLPVLIDRRRIYVLPTRFGLFFLLLVAVMGLGALNYNNNPALLLALLLGGAGLASLLAAHLQLSGLRAEAIAAEPVAAGTAMPLRLAFASTHNRVRAGLQLRMGDSTGMLSLPAQGGGVAEIELPTEHRGWLTAERLELSTTRPLGLARAWSILRPDDRFLVYPAPERNGPPLPPTVEDGDHRRPHFAGEDLHLLRDYQRGDPLRSIAWKASARRDQLIARTWEQAHGDDVELDWFSLDLEHEARIRRLAHWVELAEREGRRWRLHLPLMAPIGPGAGAAHRHECLRALALMPDAAALR
ncbi:DUF58 domain-containing protein [Luteimonas sp. e5]